MVAVATPLRMIFSIDYKAFETNLKFMTEKAKKRKFNFYRWSRRRTSCAKCEERIELMKVAVKSVDIKSLF
ncbi:MAG: hypothetical protein Ct9H90mP2_06730 [Dehalococcoidia bacterium]|nr:MAG: hypothetical protein Ct9H90mP2_06730 [Dehalococcoidia bacterium]